MKIAPSSIDIVPSLARVSTTLPADWNNRQGPQLLSNRSIADAAHSALSATSAQMEGMDDMALSLGHRIRDQHQGSARPERGAQAARRALAGLLDSHGDLAASSLNALAEEYANLGDEALFARLADASLPSGMRLLLLALLARRAALHSRRSRQLESLLDALLEEDGWQLDLLGWIEFRGAAPALLPQIKKLYREAQRSGDKPLAAWFAELRHLDDRKRRLRVLIRAIGKELSAEGQPIEGDHLADVITDLKRLLIFLGIHEQCALLASLACDPIRPLMADDVLTLIIDIIDAPWIYEAWLSERLEAMPLDHLTRMRFATRLKRLLLALPEPCFRDEEQRPAILEALQPLTMERDESC